MLNLISKYKVILIIILLIFVSFLFTYPKKHSLDSDLTYELTESEWEDEKSKEVTEQTEENIPQQEKMVMQIDQEVPVFICGEVKNSGVYYISSKAIINDVITKAGGFTQEADKTQVNLARLITANEKIYIPKCGEQIDKMPNSYENERGEILGSKLVNINLADSKLLDTLPGIGATRADTIINYREENGNFKTIDELKNVPGIGEKIYESLKECITVE